MSTDNSISRVVGDAAYKSIHDAKILIVGAGGIGCELLKNVVLSGFKKVEIIDLDTIDLSNLNRQFLFQSRHIKRSKAVVAKETASLFNPSVDITAHCDNVKDPKYNIKWFQSFDVVFGALDNIDARRHVNKMCLAANTPLIESGTTGYCGNVQVIIKDTFECYDCQVKPTPKTYPVCTIRSTPSAPIHTIVWSKSYLLPQVFGEAEDQGELDKAAMEGENANEIKTLREEQDSFNKVREAVVAEGGARVLFDNIFNHDVKRLLQMEDMWKNRVPPTPLDFEASLDSNTHATESGSADSGIVDQRKLTLGDNVKLFIDATDRLAKRAVSTKQPIEFDKDDKDTLDFVTASSNLRSAVYTIPTKTIFEVKEMAGNIIPAIATTNAIIAGEQTLKAINVLQRRLDLCKPCVYLGSQLTAVSFETPNPACGTCQDTFIPLPVKNDEVSLQQLIDAVRSVVDVYKSSDDGEARELSVFEKERLLYDPDFDENVDKSLSDMGCHTNTFITIVDEDGEYENVTVVLAPLETDSQDKYVLPSSSSVKQPGKKYRPPPPPPAPENPRKRGREEDANTYTEDAQGVLTIEDSEDEEPPAKKTHNETITLDDSDDDVQVVQEKGEEKVTNDTSKPEETAAPAPAPAPAQEAPGTGKPDDPISLDDD
ncbi:hypothetical protein E3P99_01642 [Wallemia hederae]|uniref:Ubiquitin-activating enzyme E1-like n=1 Tax=Wallemia hederae TaxID=1540922 RepID=A0A4T0FPE4_9BASI|nr:hypothetical protein E3P99_01642 [Wallemia hederae]